MGSFEGTGESTENQKGYEKPDEGAEAAKVLNSVTNEFPELKAEQERGLPFREELVFKGKIGQGTPRIVYLLESQDPSVKSMVIKVIKTPGEDLQKKAVQEKEEIVAIKEIYPDIPDLIPDEHMIITSHPLDKDKAAVVAVQRFIGKNLRDFFNSVSKDEFLEMLNNDDVLKREFISFAEKTLGHEKEKHEVVDIVGPNNFVVLDENGKKRLRFIDPHWMHRTDRAEPGKEHVLAKIKERLSYMESILTVVKPPKP